MRVGEALKKVFEGKTLTVQNQVLPVQFHYGDQKELNLWISLKDKVSSQKYPLIWYVIANEEDAGNGKSKVDSQLILFNLTKRDVLNTTRAQTTYKEVINPLYDLVQTTLDLNLSTNLLNDGKKIPYKDEPNFGVNESNQSDFTSKTKQKEQSITTDIVDARILKLRMIINLKCINND
jgi:hypothetical protein